MPDAQDADVSVDQTGTKSIETPETKSTETKVDTSTPPETKAPDTTEVKEKDSEAGKRYQISRERERRKETEKKYQELLDKSKVEPPKFDGDNDPDGEKEQDWKIQKGIDDGIQKAMDKLGIKDSIREIQYEKDLDSFYGKVETLKSKFDDLGVDVPTKEEAIKALEIIDQKGITPEQLIAIAKYDSILSKIKKPTFKPGEGKKPDVKKEMTQDEINKAIYAKHGAFGHGA